MTTTLQDAIAAARAGEVERAQLITADVIRDNPDDPNAWYLLSHLVDSEARRAVYLARTLALDPDHPRARWEFDQLPSALQERIVAQPEPTLMPPVGDAATTEPVEVIIPEEDEIPYEVVPEAIEEELLEEATPVPAEVTGVLATGTPNLEAPDSLQPLGSLAVPAMTVADLPAEEAAYQPPAPVRPIATAVPVRAPARRNTANQALTLLLGLLLFLALLVVGMLAYLLLA